MNFLDFFWRCTLLESSRAELQRARSLRRPTAMAEVLLKGSRWVVEPAGSDPHPCEYLNSRALPGRERLQGEDEKKRKRWLFSFTLTWRSRLKDQLWGIEKSHINGESCSDAWAAPTLNKSPQASLSADPTPAGDAPAPLWAGPKIKHETVDEEKGRMLKVSSG